MKIQIASDLHIEFDQRPLRRDNVRHSDVLILAGDVAGTPRELARYIETLSFPGPILIVLGNHEFYHVTWDQGGDLYHHALRDFSSTYLLENESVIVSGTRFLGCSLWTDFFDGTHGPASEGQDGLADFRYIFRNEKQSPRGPYKAIRWEDVRERHRESLSWLKNELANHFEGKTIVLTHHAPSVLSNDPMFADSPVTGAFCNRLDDDLAALGESGPDLWIHGHCHNSSDYRLGKTRILCNPAGYPFERNLDFEPEYIVEI